MQTEEAAFKAGKIAAIIVATVLKINDNGTALPLADLQVTEVLYGTKVPDKLQLAVDLGSGCNPSPAAMQAAKLMGVYSRWILFVSKDKQRYYLDYKLTHRGRFVANADNIAVVKRFLQAGSGSNLDNLR